mmetsp:Transcript_53184/g.133894  ORF Transcript_53184/g.133894 Transcript_53184/m.133894 type:complete len:86 (+) Transcript_53184:1411-1668(+)
MLTNRLTHRQTVGPTRSTMAPPMGAKTNPAKGKQAKSIPTLELVIPLVVRYFAKNAAGMVFVVHTVKTVSKSVYNKWRFSIILVR